MQLQPQSITCKRCGATFTCGADKETGKCWCYGMPNIMPLTETAQTAADCYCPTCLATLIAEQNTAPKPGEV